MDSRVEVGRGWRNPEQTENEVTVQRKANRKQKPLSFRTYTNRLKHMNKPEHCSEVSLYVSPLDGAILQSVF